VFAWTGAALFVTSLTYFVFAYEVTFARPAEVARPGALAWNLALFSIFALHHSVFARERVRAAVVRAVSPALERSVYVWIASLLFVAVCAWWAPMPGVLWTVDGPLRIALWVLQAFGGYLALRSAAVIDVWELSGIKPARPTSDFKARGPYAWVRHPIYSGWLLLVFAVPTMTMTRAVFAVVSSVYLLLAIPFEERSLRTASDGAYRRYMQQVRWKLIPGIY
jgi:protein-S-isoprenylcysteine O-methyltransferase Ste14